MRRLRPLSLPRLHLLLAGPAIALLVVLVPPMQSPDETIHVCRAGTVSHGAFASIVDERGRGGGYVDTGLWWLGASFLDVFTAPRATMTWERFERARGLRWLGTLTFCEQPGLSTGRSAIFRKRSGWPLAASSDARSARATISRGSSRRRPVSHSGTRRSGSCAAGGCSRSSSVLPMTLFQLASTSQDALQVPGTVLAIALATRLLSSGPERPSRAPWGVVAVTAAVATGRPPLAPIALLALTPPPPGEPRERRRAWRRRIGAVVVYSIVLAAGLAVVAPSYHETRRPNRVNVAQQWAGLREHPLRFVSVVATSLSVNRYRWAQQGVGVIGWLDRALPNRFYQLAWLVLAAAVLVDPFRQAPTPLVARALYLAVFALTFVGILLAIYLIWSNVGAPSVRVAQGRYFVPLVPLLGVAFGIGIDAGPRIETGAKAAAALFAVLSAAVTIAVVVERYYG